jgi:hypothetical protein
MGEAKAKQLAHATILKRFPFCIYCGAAATTIEHMPPIQMFRLRQRPKGLEFPSCVDCNNGTGHSDLVASLLGRTYPDPKSQEAQVEIKKLLAAVGNNVPGLLQEMMVGEADQKNARRNIPNAPPNAAVLRANGPILERHMRIFGAKLGLALHYEVHGTPVPREGGVQALYFTNVNAARGELPRKIIDKLPSPQTLRQGTKHVSDQFGYSWQSTEERRHSAFYAVFNESFSILAVTALDRTEFLERHAAKHTVFAPGAFKCRDERNDP